MMHLFLLPALCLLPAACASATGAQPTHISEPGTRSSTDSLLVSFAVHPRAGLEAWRQWPLAEVKSGANQTIAVRARLSTGYPCYSFHPQVSRERSEVILRIRSRLTSEGCIAVAGMWGMEAVLGNLSPGRYRLRVIHLSDDREQGEVIVDQSVLVT